MRLGFPVYTRRIAAAVLACCFAVAAIAPATARAAPEGSPAGAGKFIERLGQEAIDKLSREEVAEDKRRAQFQDLLERGFAVEAISRFVLGRYWRVASTAQRNEFQEVFKRIVAQRFLPLFKDYEREDFVVKDANPDPAQPSLYAVRTLIARPGQTNDDQPKVQVVWRVRPAGDSYEIVDVKVEGVSMAITLRSEYNSAIQRAGGRVGTLLATLKDKLAQGAYAPDSNSAPSP